MDAPRRILYIEDNPANFRLVERLLKDEGFEVLHALDGFDGVRVAVQERESLDLILMDIHLPGMDGYEAATKLKNLSGFENIPIVAVTVNALKNDRKRSLAAGCDGYIPKPIDVHTFPQRVHEYIRGKRERFRKASEERDFLREHARQLVDRLEKSLGELRVTNDQILHKDKLSSLGEMAAGVAHELNNPLSSISFSLQMLLRDAANEPRLLQHLERIQRNVERMQKLAEGLTSFARPSETEKSIVDLGRVLADSLVLAEHEFRMRGIRVETEIAAPLPAIRASESQLHHVFVNLLKNAAQAISTRLEAEGAGPRDTQTGCAGFRARPGSDGFVLVEVCDDGAGIPPEYQDRLFTPFFTTKPRGQGTGLGLYIVKQIVEDLGGRLEVQSVVGEGTTFRIYFPACPAVVEGH